MSTEYNKIKSKGLMFTRFYGGVNRGVCLQIAVKNSYPSQYAQLTFKEAKNLKKELKDFLKSEEMFYSWLGMLLTKKGVKNFKKDLNSFLKDSIHRG